MYNALLFNENNTYVYMNVCVTRGENLDSTVQQKYNVTDVIKNFLIGTLKLKPKGSINFNNTYLYPNTQNVIISFYNQSKIITVIFYIFVKCL